LPYRHVRTLRSCVAQISYFVIFRSICVVISRICKPKLRKHFPNIKIRGNLSKDKLFCSDASVHSDAATGHDSKTFFSGPITMIPFYIRVSIRTSFIRGIFWAKKLENKDATILNQMGQFLCLHLLSLFSACLNFPDNQKNVNNKLPIKLVFISAWCSRECYFG